MSAPVATDERSNLEKLDDLQAAHPFAYNLVVGLITGLILVLVFRFPAVLGLVYALSYAGLRTYLWGDGRVLRRQYEARAVRWKAKQAERRRQR